MMHRNLVDAGKKVARAKKFDADWLFFGIPSVILWFGWFVYEIYKMNNGSLDEGLFWGGVVGGIIGAIAGFRIHFKTQRQYQEIIDNIEELTEE
jgi:membrane associated rhomboid family serine protease